MTDYEKFIHERGYAYNTEEELKAGYDRCWKASHNEPLTEDEFIAEVKPSDEDRLQKAKETYAALVALVTKKALSPSDIYKYAYYRWCASNPQAIVAYQGDRDKWFVNNCSAKITVERAAVEINREWGFEASRIKVIGTPYYEATDYMFIRFDCAMMSWLYMNGSLYQVYSE